MITRRKAETPRTHKRNKEKYENNEHLALNAVCEKNGLHPKALKVGTHTKKQFVFTEK